jgi:hypothetical protein
MVVGAVDEHATHAHVSRFSPDVIFWGRMAHQSAAKSRAQIINARELLAALRGRPGVGVQATKIHKATAAARLEIAKLDFGNRSLWFAEGNLATKSLLKFHPYLAPKPLRGPLLHFIRLQLDISR